MLLNNRTFSSWLVFSWSAADQPCLMFSYLWCFRRISGWRLFCFKHRWSTKCSPETRLRFTADSSSYEKFRSTTTPWKEKPSVQPPELMNFSISCIESEQGAQTLAQQQQPPHVCPRHGAKRDSIIHQLHAASGVAGATSTPVSGGDSAQEMTGGERSREEAKGQPKPRPRPLPGSPALGGQWGTAVQVRLPEDGRDLRRNALEDAQMTYKRRWCTKAGGEATTPQEKCSLPSQF